MSIQDLIEDCSTSHKKCNRKYGYWCGTIKRPFSLLIIMFVFVCMRSFQLNVMSSDEPHVIMEPSESDGTYPEWKNFTVTAGSSSVFMLAIEWPPEYRLESILFPSEWPPFNKVEFESTTAEYDIMPGENKTFKLEFVEGPDEGAFNFTVDVMTRDELTYNFSLKQYVSAYKVHNIDTGLNYTSIQDAIDAPETLNGHTIFVEEGTYYEDVIINKSISLIGENRSTTVIDGNKTGNVVQVVTADVSLRNFTIRNSRPRPPSPWWARGDSGIYLGGYSNNIIIRDNVITDCYGGIEILVSCNNTIEKNNLFNNSNFGIRLHDSTGNTINGNAISGIDVGSGTGIYLDFEANRNLIINNTISNTGSGININFDCTGNLLNGNKISSCTFGVSSYPCYNNTAAGNMIINCNSGIFLEGSENVITGNNVSYCEYGGVQSALSNFTVVSGNLLTHNGMGIWINKGDHNTIFCNTLMSNDHGFDVRYCNNNTFYQNNVINNTIQAYLVDTINEWNNGYPSGGNYWSDYPGVDVKSGPNQNETGSDGIGDTAHVLDKNNTDRYPLMGIVSEFTVWEDKPYVITIISNSTICNFNWAYLLNITTATWEKKDLWFSALGPDGTVGFCRIMIPRAFMAGPYNVYVYGGEVNATELPISNNTQAFLYFTYTHPTIVAIIPELPAFLILPLFTMATLLAVTVYRRKHTC